MEEKRTGTVRLQIHVSHDINDWLREESRDSGRTVSDVVRRAVEYYSAAPQSVRRPLKRGK